jgi:CBS domain-containing protein
MAQDGSERHGVVSNWMTRAPTVVSEDCSIRRALSRMEEDGIRHLLVVDGDRLTGIVSNRDVRRLALEDAGTAPLSQPVRSIMTEGPVCVAPEIDVTAAARLLLELKIGALPVRDGDAIVGIFTTADALEALLAALTHSTAR